jgi:indole-3-glycerol phosphate synthase
MFPTHTTVIASGGLKTLDDARRVATAGLDGILVGGALLTAPDLVAKIAELRSADTPIADFRLPPEAS